MIENEKRIITLLARNGPMTHKQLMEEGSMGWATVIKIVDRLTKDDVICRIGTLKKASPSRGKRAILYDLSPKSPLAIGIDFEHVITTASVINMSGQTLASRKHESPKQSELETLESFLEHVVTDLLVQDGFNPELIVGIGIGLKRLELVSREQHGPASNGLATLKERLTEKIGKRVEIDGNIRVYALYERWKQVLPNNENFLLVSVRGGLGIAAFINGELIGGHSGYPGALAHFRVVPHGKDCWCGGSGCVETVVSERYFSNQYNRIMGIQKEPYTHDLQKGDVIKNIQKLFQHALDNHSQAVSIIKDSAKYLSLALSPVISTAQVETIVLSGHFGPGGVIFKEYLEEEVRKRILPELFISFHYVPLDDQGFTVGASLLVLNDYLTSIE